MPLPGEWQMEIAFVPTLNTSGDGPLRFGLQMDGGPVEVLGFELSPTNGSQENAAEAAWVRSVIENRTVVEKRLEGLSAGAHTIRIYRIDDNVVLDELVFTPAFEAP